jgi:Tol biopolymer transport system component
LTGALSVNWYVAPLVNPDGYEYTFTSDRLWRKNRCRDAFSFLQIVYRIITVKSEKNLPGNIIMLL